MDSATGDRADADTSVMDSATGDRPDADTSVACTPLALSAGVIAHYDFEGGNLDDLVGPHHGSIQGGPAPVVPGRCGNAMTLGASSFGIIPNSEDWNLSQGSIDVWVRPSSILPNLGRHGGIVSRDSSGEDLPGHALVAYTPTGRVAVRVQGAGADGVVCSNGAIVPGEWVHIGLNFGPPALELFLDGELQTGTGEERLFTNAITCGVATTNGLVGNNNPWSVGVSIARAVEGTGAPTSDPFEGDIDELRISTLRRDFRVLAGGT